MNPRQSWHASFESHGTLVEARTGHPLLLSGSAQVWFVADGAVDVFIVQAEEGGPRGALHPLFRVDTHGLLWGFDVLAAPAGWALCAVGAPGHKLLRLEASTWLAALADVPEAVHEAGAEVDRWLSRLASCLPRVLPTQSVDLVPGESVTWQAGGSATANAMTVWLDPAFAPFRLLDEETAVPAGLAVTSAWLPVPRTTPVVFEATATARIESTVQVLLSERFLPGLQAFHRIVLRRLTLSVIDSEEREGLRLARKAGNESGYLSMAMGSLSAVLDDAAGHASIGAGGASALVAAMRLVAQASGFVVKVPPPRHQRERTSVSSHDEVLELAEASLVRRRAVALKGEWWKGDSGPLLGFMQADRQPVAILRAGGGYNLHNPQSGSIVPVDAKLAREIDPFAFSFFRSFGSARIGLLDLMKFGSAGLRRDFTWVIAAGVAVGLLGMVVPLITGRLFDSVIPGADRNELAQLTLGLLACALASAMFQITRGLAMVRAEGMMDAVIQAGVWDRLLRLPMPFFREYSAGDLAARANGINVIRQALSGTTLSSLFSAVFSLFNLLLLFYYSVKLALVALLLVSLAVAVTVIINMMAIKRQRLIIENSGRLSGLIFQLLNGMSKIRATGSETRAYFKWAELFAQQQQHQFKAGLAQSAIRTFNSVYPVLCTLLIFFMIAFLLKSESNFSTGDFLAFNAAFGGLMGAVLSATGALTSILNIVPIYERSKPILLGEPEITENKIHPGALHGEIEINNLSFRYTEDGPLIVEDLSLHIRPGEFVALVGASGSGKSTLLRLLLGFETPTAGSIFFDRQDIAGLDTGALRRQLGVVLQAGQLLAGDIFTNIVGSAANLTIDDAWEAARQAGIAEDIRAMPMGMHTVVSDGGGTLSGGQRQRILIARAIVNRPRVIFFDEATSALDNVSQAMVSESLEKLNATRIVIAHRLSTIVNADRIVVLDRGKLVQSGKYEELVNQPGLFAELAKRQIA